jgi:hypothetical protein
MDREKLKSIFWDYDIQYSADEIYEFLVGEKEIKELNRNQVIARMLTSIRWYDLVDIFGIKKLYNFLNDDVLKFIWKKSLRNRYKNVRETLQGILEN